MGSGTALAVFLVPARCAGNCNNMTGCPLAEAGPEKAAAKPAPGPAGIDTLVRCTAQLSRERSSPESSMSRDKAFSQRSLARSRLRWKSLFALPSMKEMFANES